MYVDYFGMKEPPFSIAPDPRYLYMSDRHREALAHLLYGLKNDGGFVLLTGEIGTGKTTICRRLIDQVPEECDLAIILNPKLNVHELLETICDELRIPTPAGSGIKALVDGLNARLLQNNAQGRRTVLIIDEAQNLSPEVLEQLRLLTNLETNQRKLLQIILLGQPELREIINRAELRQLAQRLTARYHLGPLDGQEVGAYIQHRLHVAGCDRMLFPPSVVRQIGRLTRGVPRLINLLCDRALLGAYSLKRDQVDRKICRLAYREISGLTGRGVTVPAMAAVLAGVLVIIGFWVWLPEPLQKSGESVSAVAEKEATALFIKEKKASSDRRLPSVWPPGFAFSVGVEVAFQDLAALWGLDYLPEKGDPCQFAANAGLRCLDRRDSLETLKSYDRPAILTLYDDNGTPFYVLLAGLDQNHARFISGGEQQELNISAIESRWFGEYRLLWQNPGQFDQVLVPGGEGENVAWLAEALTELGLYKQNGTEIRLAGTLLGALKRFQFAAGLTPDGVLGPQTIIHLQKAIGTSGPRLHFSGAN